MSGDPVDTYALSPEMCRTLAHLYANEVQTSRRWYEVLYVNKGSVYALERRGLVSYNRYRGMVSLTDTGRAALMEAT